MSEGIGDVECIVPNRDISGLGVRIALYASMSTGLILMYGVTHNVDTFHDAARTAFITSTALVVSAIVSWQTGTGEDSVHLFDALIVTTLSTLAVVYAIIVSFQSHPESVFKRKFGKETPTVGDEEGGGTQYILSTAAIIHTILWVAFGAIVWAAPAWFNGGPLSGCPEVKFWIFRATPGADNSSLRAFAIVTFAVGGAVSLGLILWSIWTNWFKRKHAKRKHSENQQAKEAAESPATETGPEPASEGTVARARAPVDADARTQIPGQANLHDYPPRPLAQLENGNGSGPAQAIQQGNGERQPGAASSKHYRTWTEWGLKFALPGMLAVAAWIYLILSTEMIIGANQQIQQTSTFSFGQILALVLLLDQVVFQSMSQIYDQMYKEAWDEAFKPEADPQPAVQGRQTAPQPEGETAGDNNQPRTVAFGTGGMVLPVAAPRRSP